MHARILLVDDDTVLLRTWKSLLEGAGHRVATAASLAAARAALQSAATAAGPIDLVLLDLQLGAQRGEDCIPEIARLQPQATVAVVSGYLDAPTVIKLVPQCSVSVPKPVDRRSLLLLVEHLVEARSGLRRKLRTFGAQADLSEREVEVLGHTLEGKTTKQTAALFGCVEGTVHTYWYRIFKKTGLHSREEVIAAIIKLELAS